MPDDDAAGRHRGAEVVDEPAEERVQLVLVHRLSPGRRLDVTTRASARAVGAPSTQRQRRLYAGAAVGGIPSARCCRCSSSARSRRCATGNRCPVPAAPAAARVPRPAPRPARARRARRPLLAGRARQRGRTCARPCGRCAGRWAPTRVQATRTTVALGAGGPRRRRARRSAGAGRADRAGTLDAEPCAEFDDDWAEAARAEHRRRRVALLDSLRGRGRRPGRGRPAGRPGGAPSPRSTSRAHRALFERLAAAGDRAGALVAAPGARGAAARRARRRAGPDHPGAAGPAVRAGRRSPPATAPCPMFGRSRGARPR